MTGSQPFAQRLGQFLLANSTLVLFVVVFIIFGLSAPRFFTPENIINFVKQASFTGIIAVGMTFVLLTAGIDLSVGSNMYLSAVVSGLLMRSMGLEVLPALIVALLVGLIFGAVNAFCIVYLRIIPFMVTLSTLVIGRGPSRSRSTCRSAWRHSGRRSLPASPCRSSPLRWSCWLVM
jgi:ribose/xylose/arabinose/galactoside ABC-type transport system permease subunit